MKVFPSRNYNQTVPLIFSISSHVSDNHLFLGLLNSFLTKINSWINPSIKLDTQINLIQLGDVCLTVQVPDIPLNYTYMNLVEVYFYFQLSSTFSYVSRPASAQFGVLQEHVQQAPYIRIRNNRLLKNNSQLTQL